jgi:hypothetical protein
MTTSHRLISSSVLVTDTEPVPGDVDEHDDGLFIDVDGYRRIVGPVHGCADGTTLCGIDDTQLTVFKSLWDPHRVDACTACRRVHGDDSSSIAPA